MTVLMVTGHRALRHPTLVRARLVEVLERLEPSAVISGGAQGADAVFADAALQVGVPLWLYLPNRHYRSQYPAAVPDRVLASAERVVVVVDRPDVADWAERWRSERWWRDNFARNAAMVAASADAAVVSPTRPQVLATDPRGGTAACLRDLARARPGTKVLWVPDDPALAMRRCPPGAPSAPPTPPGTLSLFEEER